MQPGRSTRLMAAQRVFRVTARTYALRKSGSSGAYDVEDTTNDQAYRGRTTSSPLSEQAVTETKGLCGVYRGALASCFYSASNGGQTESAPHGVGSGAYAYFTVKDDPFDYGNPSSTVKKKTVYKDLTYELSYEDPDKAVDDITVHAQVPADWEAPSLWAWSAPDGTNAFTAWPGEALTKDGDWYSIQVPGWINSVIINANEGSVQTTDLSVETGKDIWVVVTDAESAQVFYEEPA